MNNFYTVLVIPEKTKQVKKIVLPAVYVRIGLLLGSVAIFFIAFMVYDYVNVMRQMSENKRLQTENRQLKQQMQAFTTKLQSVQDALDRIQGYTTKLRIITNQAGDNSENLKKKVAPTIQGTPMDDHSDLPPAGIPSGRESHLQMDFEYWMKHKSEMPRFAENEATTNTIRDLAVAGESPSSATSSEQPQAAPTASAAPSEAATSSSSQKSKRSRKKKSASSNLSSSDLAEAEKKTEKKSEAKVETTTKPDSTSNAITNSSANAGARSESSGDEEYYTGKSSSSDETNNQTPNAQENVSAPLASKNLNDLIREDQEKESAELREDFAKLHMAFDSILQHALTVELDVQSLTSALLDQKDYLDSMPTLKPTNGWYTSGFGVRNSPFTGKSAMHEGLDLANHLGSAIVAPASGVITYAAPRPGYGNLITVEHGYGIQTQFGHVSRSYVKVGEKVKRGQKIGAVGNTGRSTGPHVHYEVRVNGIPVDPYYYILEE